MICGTSHLPSDESFGNLFQKTLENQQKVSSGANDPLLTVSIHNLQKIE